MTDHAFLRRVWPDMCAAYRDASLGRACLDVQENYGADVPLLLVLCIADKLGHGIARDDLEALIVESEDWRKVVIQPLHLARQAMKGRFTAPSETGLRDDIKRLELEAERLHVQRLAEGFPPSVSSTESAALSYLGLHKVPVAVASAFQQTFNLAYDAQVLPVMALD